MRWGYVHLSGTCYIGFRTEGNNMSMLSLADELVKIINSGDLDYATDYYREWCSGIRWPSLANNRIKQACDQWNVDPTRFGYQAPTRSEEHITYDWKDGE